MTNFITGIKIGLGKKHITHILEKLELDGRDAIIELIQKEK